MDVSFTPRPPSSRRGAEGTTRPLSRLGRRRYVNPQVAHSSSVSIDTELDLKQVAAPPHFDLSVSAGGHSLQGGHGQGQVRRRQVSTEGGVSPRHPDSGYSSLYSRCESAYSSDMDLTLASGLQSVDIRRRDSAPLSQKNSASRPHRIVEEQQRKTHYLTPVVREPATSLPPSAPTDTSGRQQKSPPYKKQNTASKGQKMKPTTGKVPPLPVDSSSIMKKYQKLPNIRGKEGGGALPGARGEDAAGTNRRERLKGADTHHSHHSHHTPHSSPQPKTLDTQKTYYSVPRLPSNTAPSSTTPRSQRLPRLRREPGEEQTDTLTLAIKLPNSRRLTRRFLLTDSLHQILAAATAECQSDLSDFQLVNPTLSRVVYTDMSQSIQEAGINDRTLLHIQEPEE